ncbi:MAG: glycosyltransferase family 2 protein [archaeon]|nr:MAG: glycosyltransferase family 2 protein [archaeon]
MVLPQLPTWIVYPILAIGFFIAFFYFFILLEGKKIHPRLRNYFPEIAFVIPARDVEKYIEKTIKHVLNQTYKSKIYIVVVNDASKDKTPDIVKKLARQFNSRLGKIILLNRKKSIDRKAAAVNTGLRYILKNLKKVEVIAPLDADTFIDKDIITKALAYFESDPHVGAVVCPLYPYNKKSFLEKMQYVEYIMSMFYRKLLHQANSLCFTPAFSIFRAKFFREAGLFSENTWTEDFDVALRVRRHFYKIAEVDSKAEFVAPETLGKLRKERIRWAHGTWQALFKDHSDMISPKYGTVGTFFLPVTVLLGTLLIVAGLIILIYGIIAGLSWVIHNFSIGWEPLLRFKLTFFDISVLFSDPRLILALVAILVSVIFLVYAQKLCKRKINLLYFFLFFIPYAWFLAYANLEGLIRYIFKLKMGWGRMHK